jgi:alanine transaminase
MSGRKRQLSPSTMHANSREAEYAVRGVVSLKAAEMQKKLQSDPSSVPFTSLISCNIGNPQALGQKPLTFCRQVAAACMHPPLLDYPNLFPADVVRRARAYIASTDRSCGLGAYTDSHGLGLVKEEIARFITERDGFPCIASDLALTTGASEGVRRVIQAIIAHPNDGLMISAPQYPLYACTITMCGGKSVFYDLDEDNQWTINECELIRAFDAATAKGINVRGIVVINPGNPVGAVLDEHVIKSIIMFAAQRNLLIFADEVYQANVYSTCKKFHSFKRCLRELQASHPSSEELSLQQLVSFHTVSKGIIGECGQRGGYVEYVGFSEAMALQMRKLAASTLSSNTIGQIFCGLMVNPPKPGDESYALYEQETHGIFESLKRRADKLYKKLNELEGVSCQPIEGAMYAFPSVKFPQRAIEEAQRRSMPVDEMYCLDMVSEAGIVTVPGSGFGQKRGTYHFRTTILPSEKEIDEVIDRLSVFHARFMEKYADQPKFKAEENIVRADGILESS